MARGALLDGRFGLGLCRRGRLLWGSATYYARPVLPWREAALERYKMRHSYYGDLQGSFEGTGWEFFKRGWWLWLLALPLVSLLLAAARLIPGLATGKAPFSALSSLMLLAVPFIYGAFKAIEWRWWLSGIRFGEVRFESTLLRGALIGLYWKVIGWFLLFCRAVRRPICSPVRPWSRA